MYTGLANTVVRLHTADGREVKSFVQTDGTFEFHNVPAGSHLLQAFQLGYFYPEVCSILPHTCFYAGPDIRMIGVMPLSLQIKVETSAKSGLLRATLVGQQKPVVSVGKLGGYRSRLVP
jgi:hypothetical protein